MPLMQHVFTVSLFSVGRAGKSNFIVFDIFGEPVVLEGRRQRYVVFQGN
jgi:hypothetical protein